MIYTPTAYDRTYDMAVLLPQVDVTTGPDTLARPGQKTILLDFLDQGFTDLLDGIQSWATIVWTGQKITTLCYGVQGITSAWLIVLAFNGLCHPMQLQHGMILRIPVLPELQRVLNVIQQASLPKGRVVSI